MKPLAYTSPYSWMFWLVFLWAYLPEFRLIARSRPQAGEKSDRGSMQIIMLAGWIGSIAAFWVASIPRFEVNAKSEALVCDWVTCAVFWPLAPNSLLENAGKTFHRRRQGLCRSTGN